MLVNDSHRKSFLGIKYSLSLDQDRFIIPLILVILAPFYLYNAIKYPLPIAGSGLFTLMAEKIASNQFRLPLVIPFYGPGGIPFAYPPLALYLMAFSTSVLHISVFTYIRFAPAIFSFFSLIPIFYLSKEITKSTFTAIITILLFSLPPAVLHLYVVSGGVVRGLAYLISTTGLLFAWRAIQGSKHKNLFLASLLFALTILTHLLNALFLAVSIFVFSVTNPSLKKSLKSGFLILFLGLFISSPWWLFIIKSYGISVFIFALSSHNNLGFLARLTSSQYWIYSLVPTITIGGFFIPGLILLLFKKKFLLPVWLLFLLFLTSEGQRNLVIPETIIVASFLYWVRNRVFNFARFTYRFISFISGFMLAIIIIANWLFCFQIILAIKPVLNDSVLELATWVQKNTSKNTSYLAIGDQEDTFEWLPYLFQRTPVISHWGAEWKGTYASEVKLLQQTTNCFLEHSLICIEKTVSDNNLSPRYLILQSDTNYELFNGLNNSPNYHLEFQNSSYSVWSMINP